MLVLVITFVVVATVALALWPWVMAAGKKDDLVVDQDDWGDGWIRASRTNHVGDN